MCVMFLYYISDEKIKTTRNQVTTQSNIPVSNFVLLNSVDSLVEHEVSLLYFIYKGLGKDRILLTS